MTLAPGQRGSLTAYGQLAPSIAPSGTALRGVPGQEQPTRFVPPGVNHFVESPSRQKAPAPEASRLDAPQGGQLVETDLQPNRGRISFSELASQNGVRKWTDEIIDDRWVLRSDEMLNVDPRRRSVITVSPTLTSSAWYNDAQARAQEACAHAQAQTSQATVRQMQDVFVGTILDRRARSHCSKVTGQDVSQSHNELAAYTARISLDSRKVKSKTRTTIFYGLVEFLRRLNLNILTEIRDPASLREVKKLAKLFHEYLDDSFLLPSALPFSRSAMRDYLRERIFGPEDSRFLIRSQREQRILYGSNPITRDALRKYLFVVVDGMAEDMTSPRCGAIRDLRESRLLNTDSPVNTSSSDPSPSEDFDSIQHYLSLQKARKPDMLPDDRQLDPKKSHHILPTAPQQIPDEQRVDQRIAPRAPQWISDERQMDRQMNQKVASTILPVAPDERQIFSNARPPNPYERQTVSRAPPLMPYPGYGMNYYSQLPSFTDFNPYHQYTTDKQRHHQNFFGIPHAFPGPYHQMNNIPSQLYAPSNIPQPPPVHQFYGRPQHDSFIPAMHVPTPIMRPAASQRLAPRLLRAGLLGFDSNTMELSGHTSTAARLETAQPLQQPVKSVPTGPAQILQRPKESAVTESAQPLQTSAYMAPSLLAQSHPSSNFLVSSSAQSHPWSNFLVSSSVQSHPSSNFSVSSSAQHSLPLRPSVGSGPFPNVTPAVRPLPYQAGSDITKPQGGRASNVKLKDLTRHGKPSFAIATNDGIVPFVQNAKESKPAQWGVVKVSNVS